MIFAYYTRDTCPKGFVNGSDASVSPSKSDVAILQTFFSKSLLPALNACFYPRAFPGKDFVRGAMCFQMMPEVACVREVPDALPLLVKRAVPIVASQ